MSVGLGILIGIVGFLIVIAIYDIVQKKHAILRNFPIIGHFRYIFEMVGPELRQYIVTSNDEEKPFSRDERSWVYASSKKVNNYFGFGTDNAVEVQPNYPILKQGMFPTHEPHKGEFGYDPMHNIPCAKIVGATRGRPKAFRPASVVYVSAMSFGSLSSAAITALNKGCAKANALHNTGEGGISPHHENGADLIWQLGTGYFGARNDDGSFSMDKLVEATGTHPKVKAIEIKLSQGAKPGRGGVLPGEKVTPEIAAIRGIPVGKDCISPAGHSAFSSADELLDFAESISDKTGLPVGIKSAVGRLDFWEELAELMVSGDRGVDYIQIDGGEGGTGAAPLVFTDHVAFPFLIGFPRVYKLFAERGIADRLVWVGSGRLGFPHRAALAFALGCDMVALAREPMLSIGCIQAQRCQTGHCPTGVATQRPWLVRGLDPTSKADRCANYLMALRKELMWLTRAVQAHHPSQITLDDFEILDDRLGSMSAAEHFGYGPGWAHPSSHEQSFVEGITASGEQVAV